MFMILKRNWHAIDASKGLERVVIPAGCYEMDRTSNPYGHSCSWLMIKGTKIGASEGSWRQWQNDEKTNWGDYEVVITDVLPEGMVLADPGKIRPAWEVEDKEREAAERTRFAAGLAPARIVSAFLWSPDGNRGASITVVKEIRMNVDGKGDKLGDGMHYPVFFVYDSCDPSKTIPHTGGRVNEEPFLSSEEAMAMARKHAEEALKSGKWVRIGALASA